LLGVRSLLGCDHRICEHGMGRQHALPKSTAAVVIGLPMSAQLSSTNLAGPKRLQMHIAFISNLATEYMLIIPAYS